MVFLTNHIIPNNGMMEYYCVFLPGNDPKMRIAKIDMFKSMEWVMSMI